MRYIPLLIFLAGAALTGCGNPVDCAINGDNLQGRVTFGKNVVVRTDADVVIQYSLTSFGAADQTSSVKSNPQGLLTVPYGFCVPTGTYQLRAFEDLNHNGALDPGEPWGMLDGTDTGNGSYVGKAVTKATNDTYTRVTDADIVIDNP